MTDESSCPGTAQTAAGGRSEPIPAARAIVVVLALTHDVGSLTHDLGSLTHDLGIDCAGAVAEDPPVDDRQHQGEDADEQ